MPLNSLNQNTSLTLKEYQQQIGTLNNCISIWLSYLQEESSRLGRLNSSHQKQQSFLLIKCDVEDLKDRISKQLPAEPTDDACQKLDLFISVARSLYSRIDTTANIHRDTGIKRAFKIKFFI